MHERYRLIRELHNKHSWSFAAARRAVGLNRLNFEIVVLAATLVTLRELKPIEAMLLTFVMILLFAMSGLVLYNAGVAAYHVLRIIHTPPHRSKFIFARLITKVVSDALLVVIAMELLETIRQQITGDERLTSQLVNNFLVIGIVSAIRHLLAVGAELSLGVPNALETPLRVSLLWELGANGAVVGVLLLGLRLIHQWSDVPETAGTKGRSEHQQITLPKDETRAGG
ncbi:MAG: hypothetical protein M3290_04630 [Actinomycetota bacterium]|nr:hypothetical protein [Actinomycetota bacterium]